jgi:formylglycine-generating enzyme required for sulfatase activity
MAAQWLGTTVPTQGSLAKEALRTKEGASTYYWTPSRYASGATASLDNTVATARVAWYDKNGGKQTKDVGQKQPNALGLYDMSGNVAEYVFLDPPFDPVVGAPYTITAVGGDVFDGDALGVEGDWCTALDGCRPALTGFRVARSL